MNLMTLKKHSLFLVQESILSLLLKWVEKLTQIPLIKKSKQNSENLKEQKNNTVRTCTKCEQEKLLNKDNFEIVKHFKSGFSYYCLECNKPKPRPEKK